MPRTSVMLMLALSVCVRRSTPFSPTLSRRTSRLSSSLARRNQDDHYSVEDVLGRSERGIPPILDDQAEDDGYGAYDYVPDAYELEEMRRIEEAALALSPPPPPQPAADEPTTPSPAVVAQTSTTQLKLSQGPNPYPPKRSLFDNIEQTIPPTHFHAANANDEHSEYLRQASTGNGATTTLDVLVDDMERVRLEIYRENSGKEFNINSSVQVAKVIFGPGGGSTEKTVLEAKAAAGHRMSDLVLQYRSLKQQIRRMERKQINIAQGRQVKSPSAVVRDANKEESTDPLMLVDASNYIFRAYYSMPPIHRYDGLPTGAVMGVCNMLQKLVLNKMVEGETPRLVMVFDAKGKTFRHDLYPDYKGHRPDAPVDLIPQFQLVRDAAEAFGICQIEAFNFEADDIIATMATMAVAEGIDVNIFSSDKDLMQLVTEKGTEPCIQIIDPATMSRVTHDEVVEKFGVPPSLLGDVLALAGDAADNVPGVPGIGPKIAAQLLHEFGSLDELLANAESVKQKARRAKLLEFHDQARLSRQLVELDRNVPLEQMTIATSFENIGDLRMQEMDADRILAFYEAMGFQDIRRRFEKALNRPTRISSTRRYRTKATIPTPDDYTDVPF